jgi:hypothetical protein
MRCVKIVESPNKTYGFAAIDQQTGEVPLRLPDRTALLALCTRLGWAVQDDSQSAGVPRSGSPPAHCIPRLGLALAGLKPSDAQPGGDVPINDAGMSGHF